jgi:hypothetical protein
MNRRRKIVFIGIYIAIILAMLFVFFCVQKQFGARLQPHQKIDAAGAYSVVYKENHRK